MSETQGNGPVAPSWDAFSPSSRTASAPPVTSAPPSVLSGPSRRRRALRAVLLFVAAVVLIPLTVGVQWWDRSAWVAERYPDEVIKDVAPGQTAILRGMSWKVSLSVRPSAAAGENPDTSSLLATVEVTPASAKEIATYATPTFTVRDRAGHNWVARAAETPYSSDLQPGKTARLLVVAAVPNQAKDTAELVLAYSGREMLRFAR